MPIRRLSMAAQVKKTHSKSGKGRMGPGKRGRPRKDERNDLARERDAKAADQVDVPQGRAFVGELTEVDRPG